MLKRYAIATLMLFALTGCDQIKERMGMPDPARQAAEGNAIGSACRQAGRGLEDCFRLNSAADKASIFAGWKEMNEYMLKNNMQAMPPEIPAEQPEAPRTRKKLKERVIDEDLVRENLARDKKERADEKDAEEEKPTTSDKGKPGAKKTEPAASH